MKRSNRLLMMALFAMLAICFSSCKDSESILLSKQEVWFPIEASSDTITIDANCDWWIEKSDDVDWYSISPMEGNKKSEKIAISVQAYEGDQFRDARFTIISEHGHIRRSVYISQNTLIMGSITNKIFGVIKDEQWALDYYDQIIEDEYHVYEGNPYDTSRGYQMYFLDDSVGIQRDHHKNGPAVYYPFKYYYNPFERSLYLEFETVDDYVENYTVEVLTATDSLFRFVHQYKPKQWERCDMRKIGIINPSQKFELTRNLSKRTGRGPIFDLRK